MIVSNSSPLINLAAIDKLYLIKKLYKEIYIPFAVWDEVVIKGINQPGSKEVKEANWIKKKSVVNYNVVSILKLNLDIGEAETIALAIENNAKLLLIDDTLAREMANQFGLNYIGILGILRKAKSERLIENVKECMDLLINVAGFWISDKLYNEILDLEGEL